MLSYIYDDLRHPTKAKEQLQTLKIFLHGIPTLLRPFYQLVMDLGELKISAQSENDFDTDELVKISNFAATRRYYRLECSALMLLSTCLIARGILPTTDDLYRDIVRRLERRYVELGYVQRLAAAGLNYHSPMIGVDRNSFSSWWNNFDKYYHDYASWQHRLERLIQLMTVLHESGEAVKLLEAKSSAELLVKNCALFWNPKRGKYPSDGTPRSKITKSQLNIPLRSKQEKWTLFQKHTFEDFIHQDVLIINPEDGLTYYGTVGSDQIGPNKAPFRTLLAWLLHDYKAQVLLPSDIGEMFHLVEDFKGPHAFAQCKKFLESLSPLNLFQQLYKDADGPLSCDKWLAGFSIVKAWLSRTESFPEGQQRTMLLQMQMIRCTQPIESSRQVEECRRGLELLSSFSPSKEMRDTERSWKLQFSIFMAQAFALGLIRVYEWNDALEITFIEARMALKEALEDIITPSGSPASLAMTVNTETMTGLLWYNLANLDIRKIKAGGGINIAQTLEFLRDAEACFIARRDSFRSRAGFEAIRSRLKCLEEPVTNFVFPNAIELQLLNAPESRAQDIWYWIQAAKCRGIGSLGRSSTLDRMYNNMFLSGRNNQGEGFNTINLKTIELLAKTRVVFVDWYTNILRGKVGRPLMLTCKAGETPVLHELSAGVEVQDLVECKRQFKNALERPRKDGLARYLTPEYWLQKFEELVKPLLEASKPGDILVFSPCGVLHGLPLHGILIEGQPLIRRNPVVYTNSMRSLFYAALARWEDGQDEKTRSTEFRSKVFGDPQQTSAKNLSRPCPSVSPRRLTRATSFEKEPS